MESVDTLLKRRKVEPIVVSIFKSVDVIREHELKKHFPSLENHWGLKKPKQLKNYHTP